MFIPLYLFILIELTFVSIGDFKTRKISNWWSILNISFFILLLFIFPEEFPFSWNTLIYSGSFLLMGFILFAVKVMGGGDAKFLATFILLIPEKLHLLFFESLFSSTIVFAGFFTLKNIMKNRKDIAAYMRSFYFKGVKSFFGTKFAYAPVILLAWVLIGIDFFNLLK